MYCGCTFYSNWQRMLKIETYVCGFRGAVVSVVSFKAKGCGFKSTHFCSHTVQKRSISPAYVANVR